jgi:hypothetical protein
LEIDTSFNFSTESNGRDPDSYSPTLRKYHQLLWTKRLPDGDFLEIEEINSELMYRFNMQTLKFSSDAISNSYIGNKRVAHLKDEVQLSEFEEFRDKGSTIGAYTIFPSSRADGKMTLNGARGLNSKIGDRFDLTLECIRLHYRGEKNPLSDTLASPYNRFFFNSLFYSFKGYVEFFLLQDLVNESFEKVKFFTETEKPFENSPIPKTAAEYREYKKASMEFVDARNNRIDEWWAINRHLRNSPG